MFNKKDKLALHTAGIVAGIATLLWALTATPVFFFSLFVMKDTLSFVLLLVIGALALVGMFVGLKMTSYCFLNAYRLLRELSERT